MAENLIIKSLYENSLIAVCPKEIITGRQYGRLHANPAWFNAISEMILRRST
jgi:hypothetical protein